MILSSSLQCGAYGSHQSPPSDPISCRLFAIFPCPSNAFEIFENATPPWLHGSRAVFVMLSLSFLGVCPMDFHHLRLMVTLTLPCSCNNLEIKMREIIQTSWKVSVWLHFLLVYWCNKPTRDVGRTREKLVNHEPQASDLQAFRVFSQHPKWVYYTSKPIENAVYCFYEITRKKTKF